MVTKLISRLQSRRSTKKSGSLSRDARRHLRLETLDSRVMLAGDVVDNDFIGPLRFDGIKPQEEAKPVVVNGGNAAIAAKRPDKGGRVPVARHHDEPRGCPYLNVSSYYHGDTEFTPLDILVLVNHLNEEGSHPTDVLNFPEDGFFDVTGDGFVNPHDLLIGINAGNSGQMPFGDEYNHL